MGRKNKNNSDEPKEGKNASHQQGKTSNQGTQKPEGPGAGQQSQQHKPQQGKGQQKPEQSKEHQNLQHGGCGGQQSQQQKQQGEGQRNKQQGAWGGQQSQQQKPEQSKGQQRVQQGAWGGKHSQEQKQQGEGQRNKQQGAWGDQQSQQQRQQGEGQRNKQQGAWGGQRSQQQKPEQSKGQQRMQQGAWGGQHSQEQKQQGEGQRNKHQGAWGGQQSQQQQPQQRESQGNFQYDKSHQVRGNQQQAGAGQHVKSSQQSQSQDMQLRNVGQQRNDSNNRQTGWGQQRDQGGFRQQGADDQQRRPDQGRGFQQQAGGQQHYGKSTQQRPQDSSNQGQQVRAHNQQLISNESALPVKKISCNGIVRGTLGDPGTLEVNYLRLNLDKMPNEAYHYDISITPDRPKKFLRPAFEQFKLKVFPNTILTFDGFKNCYSMERLKAPVECTVEVPDSGNRTKEFQVRIQETDDCVVELKSLRSYQTERVFDKPMRALQVLEVVLASNNHERGIRVGRSFFRRPIDAFDLGDGYEAWTGIYQAAVLGEMPLLNVDIAHKSFPSELSLIQYLDIMRADKNCDLRSNNYVFRDIDHYFKGLSIVYTPPPSFNAPPKQYKVIGIGDPASIKKFKTDDGKETTVECYFRSRGFGLCHPNLNCLIVGSTVRQISLPMELCSIPRGQALNKKDQSKQVEKMIRYAATSTNVRKKKIMDLLTYFDHNENPIIRSFGLSIGSSFLKVPMRLLPSPSLEYLQGRTVRTFKGAWRMDENKFLICSKPPNGHRWAILYEESRGGRGITYHDLEEFKSLVIRTSQALNMNLQNTAEITPYRVQQLQGLLKDFAKNKFDLVFVVLSERGTSYAKIKQIAELEVGILTQCIKDKTVFRTKKDRTVFSNILLKVNGKLNGTNHKIAQDRNSNLLLPLKNVMYLGADVTHPSPDQREIPSVVGVAASHDPYGACYNCQYRLQRSTVENIEDMETIASRHLEVYFQYQNRYPDQILYYRDGVSDGQFPIVEREEISAIRRACAKKRCNPKLTCVIVVKRHHTRFFPLTQPQHDRDFNNVQAGTVVDQYITHPNEVQFFMVSHQSIQGTARPTRYNVIMDESKFDINLLQKLTYNLCHLFPRCNRAVSYPAPAYLAHLVAFRGRVYLEGTQRFDKNLKKEYDRRQIKPEFMNRNPMYFI